MMYRSAPLFLFLTFFVALGVFGVFALIPSGAHAQSLFTVDNVRVDVTADNALQARDQAFEQAQVKAFQKLGDTLKSSGEIETFTMPAPTVISALVQDYEITNEQLSAVRYIGTYTFRFRENASRRFLMPAHALGAPVQNAAYANNNGAPNASAYRQGTTAANAGPLLILPFTENTDGKITLWSPDNTWLNAWNGARALNGPVSVRVPIGDLQDVGDINDDNALNYDPAGLKRVMGRYNVNGAVIAVAAKSGNSMNIDIYRPKAPRPIFVQRITVNAPADNGAYGNGSMNLAVMETFKYLQANAPSFVHNSGAGSAGGGAHGANNGRAQTLHVRVPFTNPREWAETQNVLRGVGSIKGLQVKSLSPKSAYIDIAYHGERPALFADLEGANITVNAPARGQTGMTELRLSRYGGDSYIQRF